MSKTRRIYFSLLTYACLVVTSPFLCGQSSSPDAVTVLYQQLQNPAAIEKSVHVENLQLQRDRVTLSFTNGIIYFPAATEGHIRSAVFIGYGTFHAAPPPVPFELENVRRLLKADDVSSDFRTAVFRFTDDSAETLGVGASPNSTPPDQAKRLATDLEPRLLKETGMNISARQMESILNHETPGVFLAQMDGGKRGRFTYLFDPQTRIPVANFDINAGEKGLIFAYDETLYSNDIWMAFHGNEDYTKGNSPYSNLYNLVDTDKYTLTLDLMEPHKILGLSGKMEMVSRVDGLRMINFAVGEGLSLYDEERRKKQLRILSAQLDDGTPLPCFQETWESGFSVALPKAIAAGQHLSVNLDMKGDFMMESPIVSGTYFPRSTETWYPRHGYLSRSKFDITMLHRKRERAVTVGELVTEGPAPDVKDAVVTQFRMDFPAAFVSFAVGPYEIHKDIAKEDNGKQLPIEFYSMPGTRAIVKEDFILAEMSNSVRFFSQLFGEYPYPLFRGVYHPFNFGQGFPTTIMIPAADRADYHTFSFIAHETSHQWWGDLVLWRSYRDQWLSEGFAEYSGMLYVQFRDKTHSERELIREARETLANPPANLNGISKGRLAEVGPLIMGGRVETRETRGAYTALTYSKGALVLRMLHFLFTNPQTGDGQPFFDLMSDFVRRHSGSSTTSAQFFDGASERVKDTALCKKYGYTDLKWFYRQWVTESYFPSYELHYHIEDDAGGGAILKGEVLQKGLPENEKWFMPLPLVVYFAGGTTSRGTVAALGPQTPFVIKLPKRPEKVELDPDHWILSEKTSTSKQ